MEACMMKPEVKKKPKPPKPPPKPVEVKIKESERPEKPTPVMSYQHTDATNGKMKQQNTCVKLSETPRVPPRSTEKSSRETEQPEAAVDEAESNKNNQSVLTGTFQLSKKEEKLPTFTSYVAHTFDEEEKTDDIPAKQGSSDPSTDPGAEETRAEKEQSAEKNKQEKNAEAKQDKVGLLTGMFWKTPKDRSRPPAPMVSKINGGPEDAEEEQKKSEQTHAKGNVNKKSDTPVDEPLTQDNLSAHSELSASNDSLSEHKESRGIFSGMFRRSPKPADSAQIDQFPQANLSGSNDSLSETNSKQEKGFFSGILRKSPKINEEGSHKQDKESVQTEASVSDENQSENSKTKEKGNIFNDIFKKSPNPSEGPQLEESAEPLRGDLSASADNLLEKKEKGGLFGLLRKTPKTTSEENLLTRTEMSESRDSLSETSSSKEKRLQSNELSGSSEGLAENNKKEKGGLFNGIFKKPPKPAEAAQTEEDVFSDTKSPGGNENEKGGGLFGVKLRKTPKGSGEKTETQDREAQSEPSASSEDLSENIPTKEKNIFSNMFKKQQKPAEGTTAEMESEENTEKELLGSSENLVDTTGPKEKKGGLAALFKRSPSIENLLEEGNSGGLASIFKKSPKPAPRTTTSQHPLSDSNQLSDSSDSLTEAGKEDVSAQDELSGSNDNLSETSSHTKEKKVGFSAMFKRTPKTLEPQDGEGEDSEVPEGGRLRRRRTIKKKRRVVSFRVKKTLPRIPKLNSSSQSSVEMPIIEETLELQDMTAGQDQESEVEVQPVEMAAYPTEENPVQTEQEKDELMEWWNTVKGWKEWNENSNFQEEDEQMAMEQAADRVYMAARLFVHLFNQRGASLQHHILELLAVADAADEFHKKTVSAAVGGGVASVAGSVATITGLILAPFTFGASIIVTAVGIGVATAGSITSATANITDTVHSNMGRKKVEKMIQGYQEEIKDIRECLEFVQEGMDTLQEWDFEKFSESAAKKAMNHNIKHVMKEGGRAGKALMINTDKLISTVQVLGVAGGAAKAAQAISVTTGVMSALFLALDVFFLAKDSHELRKGAKTKFATKIRDVCKDLQAGLLELNKVKTQLQKTMDGIEVEEYEEIEEVEVEVEDDFESDPKKLAELEQELDLMEEKLDKKDELGQKKSKEPERENVKLRTEKKEELEEKKDKEEETENNSKKEKNKVKNEGDRKSESKLAKTPNKEKDQVNETTGKCDKEVLKEESQKGSKKDKETENQITAEKEKKLQGKQKKAKDDSATKKTDGKDKERNNSEKEQKEAENKVGDLKRDDVSSKMEKRSEGRRSIRDSEEAMKPERKKEKEVDSRSTRRHSSKSGRDGDEGGRHEMRERGKERESHHKDGENHRLESWSRKGEERGVKDCRAETAKSKEEKRENKETDHVHAGRRKEPHRDHELETGSSQKESNRSHYRSGHDEHGEREAEKRGSRVESARRKFERPGGEEVEEEGRGKNREGGEGKRRGSDRDGEQEHSRRGSRLQGSLRGGLNI
ncbi:uncharacterized protein LOC133452544 isoform X2 [Cololabis saira]|uniref:uncharacterized protein LOC133452544 isoform X2 n=1 Tax=Cololabis saira TaxID=129043 RepID=UPI002AD45259|nr:uncharacterized protein LOC133452544 isoform X2 [Cololabis saira]